MLLTAILLIPLCILHAVEPVKPAVLIHVTPDGKDTSPGTAENPVPVEKRLSHALVHGITQWIIEDTEEARRKVEAGGGAVHGLTPGSHAPAWEPIGTAPAVRGVRAQQRAFPRWSVGTKASLQCPAHTEANPSDCAASR